MKLIERIGLDKVIINGFRIVKANLEKLRGAKNVTLEEQGKAIYWLEDGEGFRFLKIKDNNVFGTLVAGTKNMGGYEHDYQSIEIVISDPNTGNLQNLTVDEFKDKVYNIFLYLQEEYGIEVDGTNTSIRYMEINCTFYTKEAFQRYHRVLGLMIFNLPGVYKKIHETNNPNKRNYCKELETYYRGNRSMEIKIYDKKRQLKQVKHCEVDGNVMRIEFILQTSQKIREVFGTSVLWELTDKDVNEYYHQQFRKLFVKRFKVWKEHNKKQLILMINKHKAMYKQKWQETLLNECCDYEINAHVPLLLDLDDLLVQVKCWCREHKNNQYARIRASILRKCEEREVFTQNDNARMEEIISKVEQAFQAYWEIHEKD